MESAARRRQGWKPKGRDDLFGSMRSTTARPGIAGRRTEIHGACNASSPICEEPENRTSVNQQDHPHAVAAACTRLRSRSVLGIEVLCAPQSSLAGGGHQHICPYKFKEWVQGRRLIALRICYRDTYRQFLRLVLHRSEDDTVSFDVLQ
jgi:hypothetical protein